MSTELEVRNNNYLKDKQFILDTLKQGKLTVHFQAIFSSDGNIHGYEALSRLKDPQANIGIADLFRKAVQTQTISLLDLKCRENAFKTASQLGLFNLVSKPLLFINISPFVLLDPDHHTGMTEDLLYEYKIPKDRIVIELTEEAAKEDYNLLVKAVERYKNRGFKIAIDDFGAGYNGLNLFLELEPDYVKIDRKILSGVHTNVKKSILLCSLLEACDKLGIKAIVEGVEEDGELKALLSIGFRLFQGFYLSKPSPQLFIQRLDIFGHEHSG